MMSWRAELRPVLDSNVLCRLEDIGILRDYIIACDLSVQDLLDMDTVHFLMGNVRKDPLRNIRRAAMDVIVQITKKQKDSFLGSRNANSLLPTALLTELSMFLVDSLKSGDDELTANAAQSLENIASTSSDLLRIASVCDLVDPVLHLLNQLPSDASLEKVTSMLMCLYGPPRPENNFQAAALKMLATVILTEHRHDSPAFFRPLLPLLSKFLAESNIVLELVEASGILNRLIVFHCSRLSLEAIDAGIVFLLDRLLVHDCDIVAAQALRTVDIIAHGGTPQSFKVLQHGILKRFGGLLSSSREDIVRLALVVLANIVKKCKTSATQVILDNNLTWAVQRLYGGGGQLLSSEAKNVLRLMFVFSNDVQRLCLRDLVTEDTWDEIECEPGDL